MVKRDSWLTVERSRAESAMSIAWSILEKRDIPKNIWGSWSSKIPKDRK